MDTAYSVTCLYSQNVSDQSIHVTLSVIYRMRSVYEEKRCVTLGAPYDGTNVLVPIHIIPFDSNNKP